MNILICSKHSQFSSILSHRLKNESHEIYLLTGDPVSKGGAISNVFQKYDFSYGDENVQRIMNNITFDLVIIAGIMDFDFRTTNLKNKSVEYISGITNLILCAKSAKIPRVVYCSSLKIFEENVEEIIDKNTKPVTGSINTGALAQIDGFVTSFNDTGVFEVQSIRFPEVIGNFTADNRCEDFCSDMIFDSIDNKIVKYAASAEHMVISVQDSIQAIINVINRKEDVTVYHIEGEICVEEQIADRVTNIDSSKLNKLEESGTKEFKKLFPFSLADADNERLNLKRLYSINDELPKIYLRYGKTSVVTKEKKDLSSLKTIIRTVIETAGTFILTVLLQYAVFIFAPTITIDFYLIFVIVIAVIYGTGYAMFATVLSVLGKLFITVSDMFTTSSATVDYDLFIQVLQLVLCGVIVGLMRDNYKRKSDNLKEANDYSQQQLGDITRINESNMYIKNVYEKRIAAYGNNLGRLYTIISQLSFLDARKIIFQTARAISDFVETEHVAIYVSSERSKYYRLAASTSDKGLTVGKSLKFDNEIFFYDALCNHEVFMNRDFNTENPTFISAVHGENDHIDAIIMIWAMGLDQINLYQSTLISIFSRLVEKTMASAMQYEKMYFENSYIFNTKIMKLETFKEKVAVYDSGVEMGLMTYTIVKIEGNSDELQDEDFETVQRLVRDTDYIGSDLKDMYVLLANSGAGDAQFVLERFVKNGYRSYIVENL